MKQKFDVRGMTCAACQANVEKTVRRLDGVGDVNVNLLAASMVVEYDEAVLNQETISGAVKAAGYDASPEQKKQHSAGSQMNHQEKQDAFMKEELASMKQRLVVSIIFLALLMYLSMGHMLGLPIPSVFHGTENGITMAFTQLLLTLPVVYINRKFYQVGFKALFHRMPNMDSLIAIGSGAALVYGCVAIYQIGYGLGHGDMELAMSYLHDLYFESASMILTLITVGKYLETRSKGKTGDAIRKLMDLAPKTATVMRNGAEVEIFVENVIVDDIVVVRPGQNIPVDGVIVEGSTSIDQSALTGESIPVEKHPGEGVTAATLNKTGYFKFRATKVGDDTTLAQIIRLVEEAGSSKAPIAKLADKIAGIFVPVVIGIAVIATIGWLIAGMDISFAISTGISVLVISCPCALGLATPVAIMVGTGRGAVEGILIKSAESLETAHSINTVVMDKTGTLTEGRPRVTGIYPNGDGIAFKTGSIRPRNLTADEKRLLSLGAAIERPSEHPLSEAITAFAEESGLVIEEAADFEAVPGRGIHAAVQGRGYIAGNKAYMTENGISLGTLETVAENSAEQGHTPLYFATDNQLLGIITVADVVKATSAQAVSEFKKMGIETVMLTGDNERTAQAIGRELMVDRVIADVIPQEKEQNVRKLQEGGRKVAMIGDGINDAPALVRADVGIAIGAGTDIAIESGDIVLMKSDLLDAVTAVQLSKAVIRNIKMNLFWAFFYNIIGIPLAAGLLYPVFGLKLTPMFGAAAMSLSSVCVVTNALRLRFFKSGVKREPAEVLDNQIIKEKQEKGENNMTKTMSIKGMSCQHCKKSAEKALNAIDGIHAEVDLEKEQAVITYDKDVDDAVLAAAIEEAGFEPGKIA